jgi:hypothetical protein
VTAPIAGLIESEAAPVTVQLKVVVPFGAMGLGDAEKAVMEGALPTMVAALKEIIYVLQFTSLAEHIIVEKVMPDVEVA